MNISYEGIGAWSVTLAADGVAEGQVVKISAAGTAGACASGDPFCGVVNVVRGGYCGVQLSGLVQVAYSGDTAPAVGYETLAADGSGGVCVPASGGSGYLVVDVNTTDATCVIKL